VKAIEVSSILKLLEDEVQYRRADVDGTVG
jgi:hypothetical protein